MPKTANKPFVALLRGINVGGHRKIPMAELRTLLSGLGFRDVRTYIQSGNVVLTPPRGGKNATEARIATLVSEAIAGHFGFDVPVMVRTAEAWRTVVARNPFVPAGADPKTLDVGFLSRAPDDHAAANIDRDRSPPDEFRIIGTEIYLRYPNGRAKTKLLHSWFERQLGVACTVRNWRTTNRLLAMLEP